MVLPTIRLRSGPGPGPGNLPGKRKTEDTIPRAFTPSRFPAGAQSHQVHLPGRKAEGTIPRVVSPQLASNECPAPPDSLSTAGPGYGDAVTAACRDPYAERDSNPQHHGF